VERPAASRWLCIVAFRVVVIDTGAAALLLAFRVAAALPVFVAYVVPNGAVFQFLFRSRRWIIPDTHSTARTGQGETLAATTVRCHGFWDGCHGTGLLVDLDVEFDEMTVAGDNDGDDAFGDSEVETQL
jgi:hypothetical protein